MKTTILAILFGVAVLCQTQAADKLLNHTNPVVPQAKLPAPSDHIDNLVAKLSATGGLWQNGLYQPVPLPESAPSELLLKQILAMDHVTNYTILTMRPVTIRGGMPDVSIAALIRTGLSEKIVLFYFRGPGLGWWNRIYDSNVPAGMTPAPISPRINLGVSASTGHIMTVAQSGTMMLMFALTNISSSTLNPRTKESVLKINGVEPADWPLTIANGPRDARWEALPPGDKLEFGYAMGDHFQSPGIYDVVWVVDGQASPACRIEVRK
jgi:hypothetical protein